MLDSLFMDATPRWLLGQVFSLIALGLCVAGFAHKDDRTLLLLLIAANVAFAIQFALLKSWVASGITCIVVLRIVLCRMYHRNLYIMSGLLLATIAAAIFAWSGWTDAPALVAGILGTVGMFAFRGIVLRWWLSGAALCWVLSNFLAGSIGGVIAESLILVTNLVTIWRIELDRRRLAPHPDY